MCIVVMEVEKYSWVFFSSRRRHTRAGRVTGGKTCARPSLCMIGSWELHVILAVEVKWFACDNDLS